MHLVQKVKDYAHAFIIDTHVVSQIPDQFGARQVAILGLEPDQSLIVVG